MIVSKLAFTTLTFRPRTRAERVREVGVDADHRVAVGATNSFGAYVASAATTRVPLARIDCGTSAAIFGFFAKPAGAAASAANARTMSPPAMRFDLMPFLSSGPTCFAEAS